MNANFHMANEEIVELMYHMISDLVEICSLYVITSFCLGWSWSMA